MNPPETVKTITPAEDTPSTKRKPAVRAPLPPRNAPCPCGSGKKAKRCCLLVLATEKAKRIRMRREA